MAVYDGNLSTGFALRQITQPSTIQINTLPATSNGIITAYLPTVPYDYYWYIEIISVYCNSTSETQAFVYSQTPISPNYIVSTTNSGNLDQDDRHQPILIQPTNTAAIQWTNASIGSIGTAQIQFKSVILVPGSSS